MKKENLLQSCRYYKGEECCPSSIRLSMKANLWSIERDWVIESQNKELPIVLDEAITDYVRAGLASFQMTDDTPLSLKAFIFFRLRGYAVDAERFKAIYLENYQ